MKNVFYLLILIIFSACDSNSQNNQTKSKNTMDTKVPKYFNLTVKFYLQNILYQKSRIL